ncbi:MAG TPA: DUF2235 domain-containing protein [Vicinamibacterales bacterium]|nr:DUF2235 domain-containing protein [Vicinamibacterales bacterium]
MALYAFDGTWNDDEIDDEKDTNVCRFRDAYDEPGVENKYLKGVGTKFGWFGRIIGGITGAGGWGRVIEARNHLEEHWRGEDLVVIGFSRGAALALDFVNEIAGGVRPRHVAGTSSSTVVPNVLFLGLWDLVASFGIPGNQINLGYQLTVPPIVEHCFHAMALDERRYSFGLTRVKYTEDRRRPDGAKRAHEVWFRGGHGDVGGGNLNRARSDIALRWMMMRALSVGVRIRPEAIPPPLPPGYDPPVRLKEWVIRKRRKPGTHERVHHTVERSLGKGYNDPPEPFLVEQDVLV